MMKQIYQNILTNEGFVPTPYIDPIAKKGIPAQDLAIIEKHWKNLKITFGIGFTFITREESMAVS